MSKFYKRQPCETHSIWFQSGTFLTKLNCSERKQSLFLIETALYLQITFDSAALSLWSLFFFLIHSFSLAIRGPATTSKLDWMKTLRHMSALISILNWYCTMCWKYHTLFICVLIKCCLVVPDCICKCCPFDIREWQGTIYLHWTRTYLAGVGLRGFACLFTP